MLIAVCSIGGVAIYNKLDNNKPKQQYTANTSVFDIRKMPKLDPKKTMEDLQILVGQICLLVILTGLFFCGLVGLLLTIAIIVCLLLLTAGSATYFISRTRYRDSFITQAFIIGTVGLYISLVIYISPHLIHFFCNLATYINNSWLTKIVEIFALGEVSNQHLIVSGLLTAITLWGTINEINNKFEKCTLK